LVKKRNKIINIDSIVNQKLNFELLKLKRFLKLFYDYKIKVDNFDKKNNYFLKKYYNIKKKCIQKILIKIEGIENFIKLEKIKLIKAIRYNHILKKSENDKNNYILKFKLNQKERFYNKNIEIDKIKSNKNYYIGIINKDLKIKFKNNNEKTKEQRCEMKTLNLILYKLILLKLKFRKYLKFILDQNLNLLLNEKYNFINKKYVETYSITSYYYNFNMHSFKKYLKLLKTFGIFINIDIFDFIKNNDTKKKFIFYNKYNNLEQKLNIMGNARLFISKINKKQIKKTYKNGLS
jgi:hypothetical protein